jgi:hypothetical protein
MISHFSLGHQLLIVVIVATIATRTAIILIKNGTGFGACHDGLLLSVSKIETLRTVYKI